MKDITAHITRDQQSGQIQYQFRNECFDAVDFRLALSNTMDLIRMYGHALAAAGTGTSYHLVIEGCGFRMHERFLTDYLTEEWRFDGITFVFEPHPPKPGVDRTSGRISFVLKEPAGIR